MQQPGSEQQPSQREAVVANDNQDNPQAEFPNAGAIRQ